MLRLRAGLELDAAAEESFVREVRAEIEAAIVAAKQAGKPAASTMFDDVYAEVPRHLAEEKRSWR